MQERDKLAGYAQQISAMNADLHLMMRDTKSDTSIIAEYNVVLNQLTEAGITLEKLVNAAAR